jgi:hypothetical protein
MVASRLSASCPALCSTDRTAAMLLCCYRLRSCLLEIARGTRGKALLQWYDEWRKAISVHGCHWLQRCEPCWMLCWSWRALLGVEMTSSALATHPDSYDHYTVVFHCLAYYPLFSQPPSWCSIPLLKAILRPFYTQKPIVPRQSPHFDCATCLNRRRQRCLRSRRALGVAF